MHSMEVCTYFRHGIMTFLDRYSIISLQPRFARSVAARISERKTLSAHRS